MSRRFAALFALIVVVASADETPPTNNAPENRAPVREALDAAEQATERDLDQLQDGTARADALGRLGMLYHAQDMLEPAGAAYRRALAEHPHWRWHYLLGVVLGDRGATSDAVATYRDALGAIGDDDPRRWLVHYRLGLLLLLEGDHRAAAEALGEARASMPESAAVLAALGDAAVADEDFETALALFRKAAALAPNAGRIAYKLALVQRRRGDIEAAQRWLAKRNPHAAPVEDPLLLEVAELSLSPKFFIKAGERAWERGERDDALAAWRKAAGLAPQDADAGLVYAHALGMMGQREASLAEVRRVLALHPDAARAWYLLAHALRDAEDASEAIDAARRSLRLANDDTARTLLAALLMRVARFEEAASHYRTLGERQPDAAYYAYWLGLANLGAQKCPDALAPLRRALRQQPNWGQAHIALARAEALCGSNQERLQALAKSRQLVAARDSVDTRLTVAFAQLVLGSLRPAKKTAEADLPHPDAAMLLDAAERGVVPMRPFAAYSQWWLPAELAAATDTPRRRPMAGEESFAPPVAGGGGGGR